MRRIQLLSGFVILLLISAGIFLYINLRKQQITSKKVELQKQIRISASRIENAYQGFVEEANYITDFQNFDLLFSNDNTELIKRIKRLYLKYNQVITAVRIFDITGNMVIINKNSYDYFKIVRITNSKSRSIVTIPKVTNENNNYKYTIPLKNQEGNVFANISFSISIANFIENEFRDFYLGKESWQFFINNEGHIINLVYSEEDIANYDSVISLKNKLTILEDIKNGFEGNVRTSVVFQGKNKKLLSVYYPVNFIKNRFGIIFSIDEKAIFSSINKNILVFFISAILVISIIIFVFVVIIQQQLQAETRIRQTLIALDKIVDNLPLGVFISDNNLNIKKVNNSALQMLGYENTKEIISKNAKDFLELPINMNYPKGSHVYTEKKEIKTNQQQIITVLITIVPIKLENEDYFLNTFVDISQIERAIKAQENANKMKSQFLANMSHEIRTPMNGIIGITDLLSETNLNQEQKELVDLIQNSAEVLLRIINDILDFSKIEAGKLIIEKVPFNIRQILKSIQENFSIQASAKKLILIFDIAPEIPEDLIGDPVRLQQVFSNLIGNAIKFTKEGKIQVKININSEKDQEIELKFSVADTGIGIPKESIGKIFESFTQVDSSMTRKYGGTGLGLTISKQLVELMHGKIWVKSPSGISKNKDYPGSDFVFTSRFLTK